MALALVASTRSVAAAHVAQRLLYCNAAIFSGGVGGLPSRHRPPVAGVRHAAQQQAQRRVPNVRTLIGRTVAAGIDCGEQEAQLIVAHSPA